ncbi:MAG: transglutaminase domain-containing protein [Bacteroidetes bacterium]|nr:transglutaminase domain-containing protein [Bacteroidota bacterium]
MKPTKSLQLFLLIAFMLASGLNAQVNNKTGYPQKEQKHFYAIEISDVLCGYIEEDVIPIKREEAILIMITDKIIVLQSVLGGEVDMEIKSNKIIDPTSGNYLHLNTDIQQGGLSLGYEIKVDDLSVVYTNKLNGETTNFNITKDIVLDNGSYYTFLINKLPDGTKANDYLFIESMSGEIETRSYTFLGNEKIRLNKKNYQALKFNEVNKKTGLICDLWIDGTTGLMLQRTFLNGRRIYLTSPSVIKKSQVAKMDDILFAKVGTVIQNISGIAYMKIEAKIRTTGEWITPDDLNLPGQEFKGTVKDNLIEGVFEISHSIYDGSGAPDFPCDYSKQPDMEKYLNPENFIESDDPKLINKAHEITQGAENTWEAATRISLWVSKNITYAIPGGLTARKTLDSGNGECGAHSRLVAALCRAVGIPAKFVIGCMYTSTYGGTFGQHAWNEIYMGEAGWIPVDATATEFNFIDSGHLRLGEQTSFNPIEMRIIEYEIREEESTEEVDIPNKFMPYLGAYTGPVSGNTFDVSYKNGSLSVQIPNQIAMPLNPPDDKGMWHSSVSNSLYFSFEMDDSGMAKNMHLHQLIPCPKRSSPESTDETVPLKFRPYLGKYYFAAIANELTVLYQDSILVVKDPTVSQLIRLQPPDKNGKWMDEFNQNGLVFVFDEVGEVTRFNVVSEFILERK